MVYLLNYSLLLFININIWTRVFGSSLFIITVNLIINMCFFAEDQMKLCSSAAASHTRLLYLFPLQYSKSGRWSINFLLQLRWLRLLNVCSHTIFDQVPGNADNGE